MSHSQDPPRDGVMEAVLKCKDAGVKASSRMLKERHKDSWSCRTFLFWTVQCFDNHSTIGPI